MKAHLFVPGVSLATCVHAELFPGGEAVTLCGRAEEAPIHHGAPELPGEHDLAAVASLPQSSPAPAHAGGVYPRAAGHGAARAGAELGCVPESQSEGHGGGSADVAALPAKAEAAGPESSAGPAAEVQMPLNQWVGFVERVESMHRRLWNMAALVRELANQDGDGLPCAVDRTCPAPRADCTCWACDWVVRALAALAQ